MESNNINNNDTSKIKYIIFAFIPLFSAMLLQYAVILGDMIIIFLKNIMSDERSGSAHTVESILMQDYQQPMNMAYMTAAQYIIYGIVFGLWYYRAFECQNVLPKIKSELAHLLRSGAIIFIALAGYAGQILTDGILSLIRPIFSSAFSEYDKMVSNVTGAASSGIMLFAVFLLAPIAEEILFRGLISGYLRKVMPAIPAILIQGLLFGLYHGNAIQGIYAFILGSVLGLIAYKYGSIIPAIIMHMSLNISIMLISEKWFESNYSCIIAIIISLIIFTGMTILSIKKSVRPEA